jgi:hypothetical protein
MEVSVQLTVSTEQNRGKTQSWVVYLPPHQIHRTKIPTTKNRQWLSSSKQEQIIRIASSNKEQWTTIPACPQHNNHVTGLAILHHWITHHRPTVSLQPDTASSTAQVHHAHAARTATSTHRTGRPHQPDSQVEQPTHALTLSVPN